MNFIINSLSQARVKRGPDPCFHSPMVLRKISVLSGTAIKWV